jgi:hypothetical protein
VVIVTLGATFSGEPTVTVTAFDVVDADLLSVATAVTV